MTANRRRVRRTGAGAWRSAIAAAMLALLFATSLPALANQCAYSDGKNDNGPCIEVQNNLTWQAIPFNSLEMNLWCHGGPPPRNHKIVLNPNDSFTCRGIGAYTSVTLQRLQADCDMCNKFTDPCTGKTVLELTYNENYNYHYNNKVPREKIHFKSSCIVAE